MCIRDRYIVEEALNAEQLEELSGKVKAKSYISDEMWSMAENAFRGAVAGANTAIAGKYYAGLEESKIGNVGEEGKGGSKTVEELINTSAQGRTTKGRTTQYERVGNYENAVDDFNSLNPQNIRELSNGKGYVGELSDGRVINVRNISSEGSPTIEIQNGKSKTKFRHKEQ